MSKAPIVLDVDTGVDDACAILFAALHPDLDLRAVTCVDGNAPLADVVRNTLTVLDACGREDVPVAAGAERPLLEERADARHVHGDDGMGDLDWPKSEREPDPRHAVELLRDVLLETAEPVTLVPLAPLTNIALLLRTYPAAARGIRRIVFMGGAAHVGNATASAEFNVFHDPEAAAITLDACADLGIEMVMYGLDVFYGPRVALDVARDLAALHTEGPAGLAGRLIAFQCERFGTDSATIGDAGAVCAVVDPDGLTTERLPVRVELAGTWSRGRTIVDRRDWDGNLAHDPHGQAPASLDVALDVDGVRYSQLWLDTVTGTSLMGRVLVLGSLNVDLVTHVDRHPQPGETVLGEGLERLAGGKGANQAVAAAAAGADVLMLGAVGDDDAGRAYVDRLRALGIDTDGVVVLAERARPAPP